MAALLLIAQLLVLGGCSENTSYKNAIASAHPLATEAGMQVLRDGGNAFDAAVTVAAVLAVVEPYSSGIGGGGFWLLHRQSDGKRVMLDGRERAPLAAHRDLYLDDEGDVIPGLSMNGPLSAGIPGQVAAMIHMQENYGSLSLGKLLKPAITLAEAGFPVDSIYNKLATFRLPVLRKYSASREIFLDDDNVPELGVVIRQPQLAETLRMIASRGRAGFYEGQVARKLVEGVRQAGGNWTLDDLRRYQVIERKPVVFEWQGVEVTSASLPSSGGIVLAQIFQMLSEFDWQDFDHTQRIHLLVEAMRRAYRERAEFLGDSDYIAVDSKRLTSKQYAQRLAADIHMQVATASDELSAVSVNESEGNDTTHYSILDKAGNRVAATLSINYPFGSGFVAPGTGVLLNDEMDDFSVSPGEPNAYGLVGAKANEIASGKRMLSSMSPTFIENSQRMAIVGSPGGSRIITMVALAIISFQENKLANEIVTRPRVHHQYLPDVMQLEPDMLPESDRQQLRDMGHQIQSSSSPWGNMQVVVHDYVHSRTSAASDPRGLGSSVVE